MRQIRDELLSRIAAGSGKQISCDSGWDWILADLHAKLKYLDFNYEIYQIKEKFGTLRFYYEAHVQQEVVLDLMDDAVSKAEYYSSTTCEVCGSSSLMADTIKKIKFDSTVSLKTSGHGDPDGWLKTLCDECASPLGYANPRGEE